jgi:ethanolamine utilization protein EutQ (cupin superfamily)
MIDWKRFDWEEIFGSVESTSGLKRKQTRALRTEVQEIATAKYSDGQLTYVGDKEDGKDYIDCNGSSVEDKAQEGMFCKTIDRTKVFILKNFQGNQTKFVKTFDYIILKDTKAMSVGWATWEAVAKNVVIKDAVITSFVNYDDLRMIEFFVKPKQKDDFGAKLRKLIEEHV